MSLIAGSGGGWEIIISMASLRVRTLWRDTVGQGAGWSQVSETKTRVNDKISRLHNGWG